MRAQTCTPQRGLFFASRRRKKRGGRGGGGARRRDDDDDDALCVHALREKTTTGGTLSSSSRRRRNNTGDVVDEDNDDATIQKEVRVFIDCDNVRPKGTREEHCVRYVESFFRVASTYGTVTSISCYGNSNTFDREVLTHTKTREEDDDDEEVCDDDDVSKKTKKTKTLIKKKSLGDVLENVRIRGTTATTPDVIIKVVRTNRRAKQSADVRCMSDVVRFATATTTATTSDGDDDDASHRLAFIVSKDAGLLREAAGAYVKKRGDVIVCGDFLNVGMRKIDRHPIEEAYRALVEEKIDKTKGREGSEALAIELRLASWKDESVWFYSSNTTVGRRKKRNARGRWQEDPYLFVVPGPSSIDDDDDDDDDDDAWLWKNCVRGLPSSIRADMRDIIDAYRRNNNNNDINSDYSHRYEHLSQLLKREAKKKVLQVRDNSCFSHASDVLVYFDAGRLGAVFGKWLDDGHLEMI